MDLIKSKSAWLKYVSKYKNHYNLNDFNLSNDCPDEYPCLVKQYLTSDLNGVKLKFNLIYKKDCQKLLKAL
jgi:hypothetical protein